MTPPLCPQCRFQISSWQHAASHTPDKVPPSLSGKEPADVTPRQSEPKSRRRDVIPPVKPANVSRETYRDENHKPPEKRTIAEWIKLLP